MRIKHTHSAEYVEPDPARNPRSQMSVISHWVSAATSASSYLCPLHRACDMLRAQFSRWRGRALGKCSDSHWRTHGPDSAFLSGRPQRPAQGLCREGLSNPCLHTTACWGLGTPGRKPLLLADTWHPPLGIPGHHPTVPRAVSSTPPDACENPTGHESPLEAPRRSER